MLNGSHLGWWSVILKFERDHQRTVQANFGSIWFSSFRGKGLYMKSLMDNDDSSHNFSLGELKMYVRTKLKLSSKNY